MKDLGIGTATPKPYVVSVTTAGGGQRDVGVFLPHEQLSISVEQHGLDAYRMSADDWASASGLGATLRSWGDLPDIQLDTRDAIAIGLHADGVSYGSTQRAGSTKSVLVAAWNAVSAELPSTGVGGIYSLRCQKHCAATVAAKAMWTHQIVELSLLSVLTVYNTPWFINIDLAHRRLVMYQQTSVMLLV